MTITVARKALPPGATASGRWPWTSQESAPSAAVEVVVPDRSIPPAPEVVSGDGGGGKAVVRFRPGRPEATSAQFVVLRSADPREIGVVSPGPASPSRGQGLHRFVCRARGRILSVSGRRHQPQRQPQRAVGGRLGSRIGAPPIPTPPSPKAELVLKPSPRVRVLFAPAPQGLEAVLERKLPAEKDWVILSAVSRGGEVVDADPPAGGKAEYRIAYRTRSGIYGPASPAVCTQR